MGFSVGASKPTAKDLSKGAIERTFSPEFRNRIDAWIAFESLGLESILKVVDKNVQELEAQLVEKQVKVQLSDDARKWFGEKGFDPIFGARPMARLVQNELKKPLAELILFGALSKGGTVRVEIEDGKPKLRIVSTPAGGGPN
jgi:ATP-dependent Clp protease ATP-binding subunit ClpA